MSPAADALSPDFPPVPEPLRTFEDFPVGTEMDLGTFSLTAEEIIDFGSRFDPQPFHTDPVAAAAGPFAGLIASGWHTVSMVMRLYVDRMLAGTDSRGSPGIEQLRWWRPVRPEEAISVRLRVIDARPSATAKGRGTLTLEWQARNGSDDLVLTMTGRGMFGIRPL